MARRPRKNVNMGRELKSRAAKAIGKKKRGALAQFRGKLPIITEQPVNWTGNELDNATFSLTAISEDGSPLTYQWQEIIAGTPQNLVDGGDISGATTDTLTIANIAVEDDGRIFQCRVCNTWTCVTSVRVTISVTGAVWYIITENSDAVVDEPATSNVVDERSI